jgi:membrane protein required for colicin V production
MSLFDVSLLLIISGFVFYGLFSGLIRMVGALVALLASTFIASHYYVAFYDSVSWFHFGSENAGKTVAFIVLMSLVSAAVRAVFYVIEKVFNIVSIIPFVKSVNRLAGALFGLLEGILTVGVILLVISKYALIGHFFSNALSSSFFAPILIKITNIIYPLLPEAFKMLQSVI